jgi:hypothetical protein
LEEGEREQERSLEEGEEGHLSMRWLMKIELEVSIEQAEHGDVVRTRRREGWLRADEKVVLVRITFQHNSDSYSS